MLLIAQLDMSLVRYSKRYITVLHLATMLPLLSSSTNTRRYPCTRGQFMPDNDSLPLLAHMDYDSDQEQFYIGGKNVIYRLNKFLCLLQSTATNMAELGNVAEMDNYNQLVLVDRMSDIAPQLITCGTGFNGSCESRNLSNISVVTNSKKFLVASDPAGSAVGMLALAGDHNTNVTALYLASTLMVTIDEINKVHVISTRKLKDNGGTFDLLSDEPLSYGTRLTFISPTIKQEYGKHFFAKSVISFHRTTYFFTNQKLDASVNARNVSKVIHLCQGNARVKRQSYNSYIDMPVYCKHGRQNFTLLQSALKVKVNDNVRNILKTQEQYIVVAAFAAGTDPTIPLAPCALCMFTFEEIRRHLIATKMDNLQNTCKDGSKKDEISRYLVPKQEELPCVTNRTVLNERSNSICNWRDLQLDRFIIGSERLSLRGEAVLTTEQHVVSTLSSKSINNGQDSLIVLGTDSGQVKLIYLKPVNTSTIQAVLHREESIFPASSVRDIRVAEDSFYVLTESKLKKFPLWTQNCSSFSKRRQCLDSNNPFCGWCVYKKICSNFSSCAPKSLPEMYWWLSAVNGPSLLPEITTSSKGVQTGQITPVTLIVDRMPVKYEKSEIRFCRIAGILINATEIKKNRKFICSAPSLQYQSNILLQIVSSYKGVILAEGSIYYYNCSTSKQCWKCVQDPSEKCTWCLDENRCVSKDNNTCTSNRTIRLNNQVAECPFIDSIQNRYIHVNERHNLTIRGEHLISPKNNIIYTCQFQSEILPSVPAEYFSSTELQCEVDKIVYPGSLSVMIIPVKIYLGDKVIDQPERLSVEIYSCGELGTNCSACQYFSSSRHCQWYQDGGNAQCRLDTQCEGVETRCPVATITKIDPAFGFVDGGTRVTIHGEELGRFPNDTAHLTIAGYPCKQRDEDFQVSRRIVCVTNRSSKETSGIVSAIIRSQAVNSTDKFLYLNPSVDSLHPSKGPQSGGTRLMLKGQHLHLGKQVNVYLDDRECKLLNRNSTSLACLTTRSDAPKQIQRISLLFDSTAERLLNRSRFNFNYMEDPTVQGIHPNKSFSRGGLNITVSGTNFDVIQDPRMRLVGYTLNVSCSHTTNGSKIICPSLRFEEVMNASSTPKISKTKGALNIGKRKKWTCLSGPVRLVDVEFILDGVDPRKLRQTLEVVKNPVFFNFTEEKGIRNYNGSRLIVLQGDRLNLAARASDYRITIGRSECHVIATIACDHLKCSPPELRPQTKNDDSPEPEVEIHVGHLYFFVGYLRYGDKEVLLPLYLYIILGVLVIMVMMMFVVGLRWRQGNRRLAQKRQEEIEELELRVQVQFREAFAELQMDMTDITGELIETGIPFNEFKVYAFHILFPAADISELHTHAVMNVPQIPLASIDKTKQAMADLDKLIFNKFFLISLIETLDNQKRFYPADKAKFAGLLSSCLMTNMQYFSQQLKPLLTKYVEDAVSKKQHKGLYRRSEKITEKLLGIWLGLSLHKHLMKHGGPSLIMLFKAIQNVMEKSPIDDVTGEARATLDEDKLLKKTVDYSVLTITVGVDDEGTQCQCKVLDCDTISQVKAKCLGELYKKLPASARPKPDTVELEWHQSTKGRLILREEDTHSSTGCFQLMTLREYKVTDGSVADLVSKHHVSSESKHPYVNYKTLLSTVSSYNDDKPLVKPDSVSEETDQTDALTVRRYHLVKENEESNSKSKTLPEVHLNKLLQTKLNLKKFIDEAFISILDTTEIPIAVKYLFCLLDRLGQRFEIEQDTVNMWKNNSYPIRFWGMLIARPEILFDIYKPCYVQQCLDVIASTFNDSCSPPQKLTKNSPAYKLLFYKDQEEYRRNVRSFIRAVSSTPAVDEQDIVQEMCTLSQIQKFNSNRQAALYEVFQYIKRYKEEIITGLDDNEDTAQLQLSEKLQFVFDSIAV